MSSWPGTEPSIRPASFTGGTQRRCRADIPVDRRLRTSGCAAARRTRPRSVHPSRNPGKPKDAFLAPSRVEAPSVCGLGDDLTCFATTFWSGLGDHLTLELCDWRRVSLRGLSRESAADDACSLRTQRRCRCCLLPRPHLDNGSPVDRHSGGWKQPRACGRRPVLRAICGSTTGSRKRRTGRPLAIRCGTYGSHD